MPQNSLSKNRKIENVDIVRVLLFKDSKSPYRRQAMNSPEEAASVAKKFLAGEDREVFIAMNLDMRHKVNSIHVVAIGTVEAALVEPREIFKTAILSNASRIIVAHNHPSGDSNPSDDDERMTCRLLKCGDLLGIRVEDHIIVGDDEYSHYVIREGKDKTKVIYWQKEKFEDQSGGELNGDRRSQ